MDRRALLLLALIAVPGSAAVAGTGRCMALREALPAGAFVTREAADEVPCRGERPRLPLRYDRVARAPVTAEALAAGTYLGPIVLRSGAIAAPGDKLQLVIRQGPVTITREVSPVQAVRAGEPGFVKTGDGTIFTAHFMPAEGTR